MIRAFVKECGRDYLVGAEDKETNYSGPVARVSADKNWLVIETDAYEGHAMLNVEALPALIRALRQLQSERTAREQERAERRRGASAVAQ